MIQVTIFKNKRFLTGFEVSGHSGYAEIGKDIVCAAVSGMTQMTVVGLTEVCKLRFTVKKDDKKGYLFCKISKNALEDDIIKSQDMLNSLKILLEDVAKNYKKYIRMEVRDEIY